MKRRLDVLCPQMYEGMSMRVVTCSCCPTGWDKAANKCRVDTGAEHLPDETVIPDCPIQNRCQHQLQSAGPCLVRSKGLVCESAFIYSGMSEGDAVDHPLAFNTYVVASPEELALQEEEDLAAE